MYAQTGGATIGVGAMSQLAFTGATGVFATVIFAAVLTAVGLLLFIRNRILGPTGPSTGRHSTTNFTLRVL